MSRMVEIEVQETVNNIQIIDRTVNILSDNGKVILEYYELIMSGNDRVVSDKVFNKSRHENNKKLLIKNLRKA